MSERRRERPGPRRVAVWGAALCCVASIDTASAAGLGTALPHRFAIGMPRGPATAPQTDAMATHRSPALPSPGSARVVWQQRVPGGISANVLVDEAGHVFAAGLGRVTQLTPAGATEYSAPAPFSTPNAAALLGDGTRAVLTREGHVMGWSKRGVPEFDVSLDAPAPSTSSTLLPLADGGLLVTADRWSFEIDASRRMRASTSLSSPIQHALLARGHALLIDQRGAVFEWDRRGPPRALGRFDAPLLAALADGDTLVGLSSRRGLAQLPVGGGDARQLARFEPGNGELRVALVEAGHYVALRPDGSWISFRADATLAPPQPLAAAASSQLQLLADPGGAVAWWAAETPLHIETAPGVGREFTDIRCAAPVSLAPAGPRRILAACSSGAIWLIGPGADAAPPAPVSQSTPAPIGIREQNALYSQGRSPLNAARPQ
jgi:hypothetical protein